MTKREFCKSILTSVGFIGLIFGAIEVLKIIAMTL